MDPVAEAARRDGARLARLGQPVELRLAGCDKMAAHEPGGAVGARAPALPPRAAHIFRFAPPSGAPTGGAGAGAGAPLRYGDVVSLLAVTRDGDLPVVLRRGVAAVQPAAAAFADGRAGRAGHAGAAGDTSAVPPKRTFAAIFNEPEDRGVAGAEDSLAAAPAAPAALAEAAVCVDAAGPAERFRIEAWCDLCGVCVRKGDTLVLRAVGSATPNEARAASAPSLRLCADPSEPDEARLVRARGGRLGEAHLIQLLGVGPLRVGSWTPTTDG